MTKTNNTNTSAASAQPRSYAVAPGVTINIDAGSAAEYASQRSVQLAALGQILTLAKDHQHTELDSITLDNAMWLLNSLSTEVVNLISLVATDARLAKVSATV